MFSQAQCAGTDAGSVYVCRSIRIQVRNYMRRGNADAPRPPRMHYLRLGGRKWCLYLNGLFYSDFAYVVAGFYNINSGSKIVDTDSGTVCALHALACEVVDLHRACAGSIGGLAGDDDVEVARFDVGYAGLALGLVEIEGVKAERLAGNVGGVESQIVAAPVVAGGEVERRPEFLQVGEADVDCLPFVGDGLCNHRIVFVSVGTDAEVCVGVFNRHRRP